MEHNSNNKFERPADIGPPKLEAKFESQQFRWYQDCVTHSPINITFCDESCHDSLGWTAIHVLQYKRNTIKVFRHHQLATRHETRTGNFKCGRVFYTVGTCIKF